MFGRGFEPRNSNVKYCLPTLVICNRTAERKWTLRGLNPGPADYESDALTAELSAPTYYQLTPVVTAQRQ